MEALCLSLEDSSVLVQRGALDLLLLGFPLHQSQFTKPDLIKVLTSAVKVVLRRDMSLNRRLYALLLGMDSNGQALYGPAVGKLDRQVHVHVHYSCVKFRYFSLILQVFVRRADHAFVCR